MSLISKQVIYIAAITLAAAITSCNSSKDTESANNILVNAQLSFDNSNYNSTITLLDSLKGSYPKEVDIQRQGLQLRTLANKEIILCEINTNDSTIESLAKQKLELDKLFNFVKTKDMVEGYHVVKNSKPLINRTGIEARIDEQGNIYITTLLHGNNVKHTSLSVSTGDGTEAATETIPYNGSTNYRFNDNGVSNEMVTFRSAQCDSLNQYIKENIYKKIALTFIGEKRYSITLTKADKDMIINSYNYSQAIINGRNAIAKQIYLEQKLQIAESQISKAAELNNNIND